MFARKCGYRAGGVRGMCVDRGLRIGDRRGHSWRVVAKSEASYN